MAARSVARIRNITDNRWVGRKRKLVTASTKAIKHEFEF